MNPVEEFNSKAKAALFDEKPNGVKIRLRRITDQLEELRRSSKKGKVNSEILQGITEALRDLRRAIEAPPPSKIQLEIGSRDAVKVENFEDLKFPEATKISNLQELEKFFSSLSKTIKDTFSVEIPEPKVTVTVPDIHLPEIKIPAPQVTIEFEPLLAALTDLKKDLSKRDAAKDISGLAGIMKEIKELLKKGPGKIFVSGGGGGGGMSVDEYRTVSGTPRTGGQGRAVNVTAGVPVNVSGSSIACKYVYLSADIDAGIPLVVGFSNAVRATAAAKNGMILIPGNDVVMIETNDIRNLWFDAQNDGGVLCYSYSAL